MRTRIPRRRCLRHTVAAVLLACGLVAVPFAVAQPRPGDEGQARVIGGTEVHAEHAVSLQFDHKGNPNFDFCGGTLISAQRVLTAAHCFKLPGHPAPEKVHVRVGHPDRDRGEYAKVVKADIADFHTGPPINDLAVLHLDRRITKRPIWIAPSAGRAGQLVRLTGWGRTDKTNTGPGSQLLKGAEKVLTAAKDCAAGGIDINELCVKPKPGEDTGACGGDSGGTLARQISGRWMVVGLPSRGARTNSRCGDGAPDIHTDVTVWKHRAFIIRAVLGLHPEATVTSADEARAATGN